MKITNKYNVPAPLVSVVENDPYPHGEVGDISTTTLIMPPRIVQLEKRYSGELVEDVSENIYRLIGKNTHHILERVKGYNCIIEKRYYQKVSGWVLSGQVDLYEINTETLSDYKITSVWSVINGLKPEHIAQMNINCWLMEINGIKVRKLQIVNLLRDWSMHQVKKSRDYPECQIVVQEVPMWELRDTLEFIIEHIKMHQVAETVPDKLLPHCTSKERWERPTKFAVMKPKRKSALRLLDSQEDAEKYISDNGLDDKHYIDVRVGESVRCEHYCNVKDYCSQYKEMERYL